MIFVHSIRPNAFPTLRLSGIAVGLLIIFNVLHLRDGIKRMVDGRDWEK